VGKRVNCPNKQQQGAVDFETQNAVNMWLFDSVYFSRHIKLYHGKPFYGVDQRKT